MKLLTRLPLRRRIMVFVSAGLGLTLLTIAVAGLQVIAQSTQRILEERRITAQVSAANLDQRLEAALERLETVASTLRLHPSTALHDDLIRAEDLSQAKAGLFSGGILVADRARSAIWPEALRGPPIDDPALAYALEGTPALSGSIRLPVAGLHAAVMWVPVRGSNGAVLGALGGVVDLQSDVLTELIRPLAFGQTGHAVIVDGEGIVLAGTEAHEVFTRGDHPEFFSELIRAKKSHVGKTPEIHDGVIQEDHVMAFAPLRIGNWGLGFGQAEWEVFVHERHLGRRILLLGLLFAGVALLVAWWDAGVITTPLRRLTLSAGRMAAGDLSTPISPAPGVEVGLLAQTLEGMRRSLAATRSDLELRTEDLRRQAEQTRALYDVSRAILSDAHLSDVLGTIVSSARTLLPAEVSSVCLWDGRAGRLVPGAFDGPAQAFQGAPDAVPCAPLPGGGWQPAADCPFVHPQFRRVHITADVRVGDRPIGFMCVGSTQARPFGEADAELLDALASLAALAIDSAQLRDRVQDLAVLEERERIGRDLHDSLIQSLYGISLGLEHAQGLIATNPGQASFRMERAIESLTAVVQGIRSYVVGLHPQHSGVSLADALDRVVRDVRVNTLLPVELQVSPQLPALPDEQRLHAQLLVREALANAVRHAAPTHVTVRAIADEGGVRISVVDDGRGFDPAEAAAGTGLGLRTMAERARRIGGTLTVRTARGAGTTVEVHLAGGAKGGQGDGGPH